MAHHQKRCTSTRSSERSAPTSHPKEERGTADWVTITASPRGDLCQAPKTHSHIHVLGRQLTWLCKGIFVLCVCLYAFLIFKKELFISIYLKANTPQLERQREKTFHLLARTKPGTKHSTWVSYAAGRAQAPHLGVPCRWTWIRGAKTQIHILTAGAGNSSNSLAHCITYPPQETSTF